MKRKMGKGEGKRNGKTDMMISQVKNPQWPELEPFEGELSASSQAFFVFHSRFRIIVSSVRLYP